MATAAAAAALIGRAGFPLPSPERRIGCIDGMRGFLALAVAMHHFAIWLGIVRFNWGWWPPASNVLESFGSGAVALFFATTGLVFYGRVADGFARTDWVSVYISRVARIVPLTAVSIGLVCLILIAFDAAPGRLSVRAALTWLSGRDEPALLGNADAYRVNARVLWSLWFEWLFYLAILPACALARDLIRGRAPAWLVPAAFLLVALVLQLRSPTERLAPLLPMFAVGMSTYEVLRHDRPARLLASRWCSAVALACLGAALARAPGLADPVQVGLYGVFFAAVAAGNSMFGVLRSTGALVLGDCSFGIYLLHGNLLTLLFWSFPAAIARMPDAGLFILLPAIAIMVAGVTSVSYLLVERPCIRAGSGLQKRWKRRRIRSTTIQADVAP